MKQLLFIVPFIALGSSSGADSIRETLFLENCVSCHGIAGQGDGPNAKELGTAPADLTKISAQRGGVWPMLEIMSIIDGYSRNTVPREDMPVFENFLDNEMVEFDTGNGVDIAGPQQADRNSELPGHSAEPSAVALRALIVETKVCCFCRLLFNRLLSEIACP